MISDFHGLVLDVVEHRILVDVHPVVRITEDELHDLVYLITFGEIVAVGAEGIVWESERLALDDVKIVRIEHDRIVCSGFFGEPIHDEFVIDPRDGSWISGRPFPS